MKHFKKPILGLILAVILLLSVSVSAATFSEGFRYEHDPRLNPAAMADIITDPTAVYGFRPDPASQRLGAYAEFDWSDQALIAESRQARIEYHESMLELYELEASLAAEGKDIETIARAVSAQRNLLRLRGYENNPEGLAAAKASNLETYGDENGPTADSLYEKYGSWETVLEKAFSTNSGMDACLGLYDDYYELYLIIGQIPNLYYLDAMQWAYRNYIPDVIPETVYTPETLCTRAEAVTLLWSVMGCPTAENTELPFADLDADSYYNEAVLWAAEQGITVGTSEGRFSPDAILTRAQFVTLLMRCYDAENISEAECVFDDLESQAYYYDAVLHAAELGITVSGAARTFRPYAPCSRAEAVTFLWRCATISPKP